MGLAKWTIYCKRVMHCILTISQSNSIINPLICSEAVDICVMSNNDRHNSNDLSLWSQKLIFEQPEYNQVDSDPLGYFS